MRKISTFIISVVLSVLWMENIRANPETEHKPTCAIITFVALEGVSEGLAQMISERIITEFGRSGQFRMIERTQAENVLRENQIAMVSLDTSMAMEAGKIMAAEYVLIGSVGKIGNLYTINSRLVSVERGTVTKMATTDHIGTGEHIILIAAVNNARQLLDMPLLEVPAHIETPSTTSTPDAPESANPDIVLHQRPPTIPAGTPTPPLLPSPRRGAPIELAWIPEGNLILSAKRTRSLRRIVPVHGFWMAKHEITQDQWEDLMGSNPSRFKGGANPVENVTWNDAVSYCKKLENVINAMQSDRETRRFRVRLPIDSEWEYACLAGATTTYSSGDSEADLNTVGWYSKNSNRQTQPAGLKKPNRWGLHDMHGNVAEWCDNFAPSSSRKITKGGSFTESASRSSAEFINSMRPNSRANNVGFRVIITAR